MSEKPNIEKFFNGLNKDTMHLVDEFYDQNIEFHDPLINVKGRDQMNAYYKGLYDNVTSINFIFSEEVVQGDSHVVAWKMIMESKLNNGKPTELDALSLIKFGGPENKAIYHRDYYDMGQFVYQYVPILKNVIKYVNGRLSHA
jgi:hypothetical protein